MPGHVRLGEHEPAVEEQDPALDLDGGAVAPDLPQPAEERDGDGTASATRSDVAAEAAEDLTGPVLGAGRARGRAAVGTPPPGGRAPAGRPWRPASTRSVSLFA